MGDTSRRHHWYDGKMMSVKRVQKFRTDDMLIPRSGSAFDWLKQTFRQSDLIPRSGL